MIDSPRQNPPPFDWFRSVSDDVNRHRKTVTVAAAYTVQSDVFWVRVNAASGAVAVTLPPAASWWGRQIGVKKVDNSVNLVTVTRSGSDVIDGASTKTLAAQYERLIAISDGNGNWDLT